MEAKFTKGPWVVYEDQYHGTTGALLGVLIIKQDGGVVAQTFSNCQANESECRANAALIAAAPDLYAALVDVIGWIPGAYVWHTDGPAQAVERARAALAAARGEA